MFANELDQLLAYLDLETLEVDLFRGRSPSGRRDRIFGGQVLAQDEASSVVWGMPGAVATAGLCEAVLPLNDLGPHIMQKLRTRAA